MSINNNEDRSVDNPIVRKIQQTTCKDGSWISTIEILIGEWLGGNFESLTSTPDNIEIIQRFKSEEEALSYHQQFVEEHSK